MITIPVVKSFTYIQDTEQKAIIIQYYQANAVAIAGQICFFSLIRVPYHNLWLLWDGIA